MGHQTMKVIVALLAAAAVISAAPTDTEVPDSYAAHAEAQQTIDQLLQDGKDDSACRSLAKTTIKDIKTSVETSQKTYDAVDKGFNCHKEGQDAVVKAKEQKSLAEKKLKDATSARKAACSAQVTFAPRAYNSLKENECSTFFSDAAYTAAKKKCSDSKSAEAKAEGELSAAIKAVKSAEEAAAKARAECECKTHKANKAAFEAATKNHEANKKAWVKAHHMLCVLDGVAPDKCVHLSVPFVAKAPVCQKCDGSTCVKIEPLSCKHASKRSNNAGVIKTPNQSGYTLTGGGMINHYRSWDKKSGFEQMYPDGNQYNCDTGFGPGPVTWVLARVTTPHTSALARAWNVSLRLALVAMLTVLPAQVDTRSLDVESSTTRAGAKLEDLRTLTHTAKDVLVTTASALAICSAMLDAASKLLS